MFLQSCPSPVRSNLSSRLYISTPRFFPSSVSDPPLLCPLRLSSLVTFLALAWISQFEKQTQGTERGTMKEQENRIVQQERPTSKLTTGCEGVTLASALTLFHSFFFATSLTALYILFGGKVEHLSTQWHVKSHHTL